MRLDKLLLVNQLGSKQECLRLIKQGKVKVNGKPLKSLGAVVDPGLQEIWVGKQKLVAPQERYFLLNKPQGVVTAVSDMQHQTVLDLVQEADRGQLLPVGRLDRSTEGLLLLTSNRPLLYRLLNPEFHVAKTYYVEVNGWLGEEAVKAFEAGICFNDGTQCRPAQLEIMSQSLMFSTARVTITQGKFHQVKKMFLCVGVWVSFLKRESFGPFKLDATLEVGHYRALYIEELTLVRHYLDEG